MITSWSVGLTLCNVFFVMPDQNCLSVFLRTRDPLPKTEIIKQIINQLNIESFEYAGLDARILSVSRASLRGEQTIVEKLLYLVLGAVSTRNIAYPTAMFFSYCNVVDSFTILKVLNDSMRKMRYARYF